jgi:hypothetical protein
LCQRWLMVEMERTTVLGLERLDTSTRTLAHC